MTEHDETTVEWPPPADDPDQEPSHPGAKDDDDEPDTESDPES